MNAFLHILAFRISVGLPEVIVFQIGAIILGFCIHLFITTRRSTPVQKQVAPPDKISETDDWKLKYYDDMEDFQRRLRQMEHELRNANENEKFLALEVESLKEDKNRLIEELEAHVPEETPAQQPLVETEVMNYLQQLRSAQENLTRHNQHILHLLQQIEQLKESENKYNEMLHANEVLNNQLLSLRSEIAEKESEIRQLRSQHRLSDEMRTRLEKVYSEYHALQEKVQKLETNLSATQGEHYDYEALQETYFKLTKDFDELKLKQIALLEENQRLNRLLTDTEDKLRESNFQRQQLNKKVTFLEELNNDLKKVAEHNNKLQSQMRRISEIESLLTKAAQTRSGAEESGMM